MSSEREKDTKTYENIRFAYFSQASFQLINCISLSFMYRNNTSGIYSSWPQESSAKTSGMGENQWDVFIKHEWIVRSCDNNLHKFTVLSWNKYLDMHANRCTCATIYIDPSKNMVLRTIWVWKCSSLYISCRNLHVKWLMDNSAHVSWMRPNVWRHGMTKIIKALQNPAL